MYTKTLTVQFDANTFPTKEVPTEFVGLPQSVDMGAALLLLGSVTIPGGFSIASPARYWAWVRYFSALSREPDLRITDPFADLDPHQKSVLSDDFGVAVTTQWLNQSLKGFKQVVDGRRFVLQYAHLLAQPGPQPAKVGPTKCPDFVVLDNNGKWHALECKGTQTSLALLRSQLARAREQKQAIAIDPALAGHRLAAGLFLAADRDDRQSRMEIHDPAELEPLIRLEDSETAANAMSRLTAARSLGLAGYTQVAAELAVVETKSQALQRLLTTEERRRAVVPQAERREAAMKDLQVDRESFEFHGEAYFGRRFSTEIFLPELGYETRRITVKHGIESEFLRRIRLVGAQSPWESVASEATHDPGAGGIVITSDDGMAAIKQGDIAVSIVSFD